MKVTILMSTYNGEKYLSEQLDSIINQDLGFENIRIVIRDDGSKDSTIKIIKKYKESFSNIHLLEGDNLGPAQSFWHLVMNTTYESEYFAFSDQDDIWLKNKLSTAINSIKNLDEPALSFSNAMAVNEELKPLGGPIFKDTYFLSPTTLLAGLSPMGCGMVFNKKALKKIQNANIKTIEMHDLTTILLVYLSGKVFYNNDVLFLYRQHQDNVVGVQHNENNFKKKITRSLELWLQRKVTADIQANDLLNATSSTKDIEQLLLIAKYKEKLSYKIKLLKNPYIKHAPRGIVRSFKLRVLLNLF